MNTTDRPKKGDIVTKIIATKEIIYWESDSFTLDELDQTIYEVIGVCGGMLRGKAIVIYKEQSAALKWASRWQWMLTGYTLDGTERTGTLRLRGDSTATADNFRDIVFTYTATTTQELCDALNAVFTTDEALSAVDYWAFVDGDDVKIQCNCSNYNDYSYSKAKDGFAWSVTLGDNYATYNNRMRGRHGGSSSSALITNIERAKVFFAQDISNTAYNPQTDVTTVRSQYPICLPAYLGQSQYCRDITTEEQLDHCKLLRDTYGEGEEGWLRYLDACRPVVPCDYGVMTVTNGAERTAALASKTYVSSTVTEAATLFPAAAYAYNIETESGTISKGEFHLPTPEELYLIMKDVKYGTNSSRESDVINASLYKIGGSALSNGLSMWSCVRSYLGGAWNFDGSTGCINNGNLINGAYRVRPLSLYPVSESEH